MRDQRVMRNYQGPHRGSTVALDWAVCSARVPIIGQLGRANMQAMDGDGPFAALAFVATKEPCSSPENRLLFMQLPIGTGPDKNVLCCNCESAQTARPFTAMSAVSSCRAQSLSPSNEVVDSCSIQPTQSV